MHGVDRVEIGIVDRDGGANASPDRQRHVRDRAQVRPRQAAFLQVVRPQEATRSRGRPGRRAATRVIPAPPGGGPCVWRARPSPSKTVVSSRTVTVPSMDATQRHRARLGRAGRLPGPAPDQGGGSAPGARVRRRRGSDSSRPSSHVRASPVVEAGDGQASSWPSTNSSPGVVPETSAQPASAPMRSGSHRRRPRRWPFWRAFATASRMRASVAARFGRVDGCRPGRGSRWRIVLDVAQGPRTRGRAVESSARTRLASACAAATPRRRVASSSAMAARVEAMPRDRGRRRQAAST